MALLTRLVKLPSNLCMWVIFWVALGVGSEMAKAEALEHEFQLKAAYIFHFAELTKWPDTDPSTICLLGSSPLRASLPALEGQIVNNQAIHIKLDNSLDISTCDILFLSDTALLSRAIIRQAAIHSILLVSDARGFAQRGGMMEFSLQTRKLRLIANMRAIREARLRVSSKLLRMAEILE